MIYYWKTGIILHSLVIHYVEPFSMWLITRHKSYFRNCFFMSLIYFLSGILMLSLSNLMKIVIHTAFKLKLLQVLQTPQLVCFYISCVYILIYSQQSNLSIFPFISPSFSFKCLWVAKLDFNYLFYRAQHKCHLFYNISSDLCFLFPSASSTEGGYQMFWSLQCDGRKIVSSCSSDLHLPY